MIPFVSLSTAATRFNHPRGRNTFANVTEVATPDPLTAVIVLSQPAPFLIKALAGCESGIVPKHIYDGTDPVTNPNGNAPIGTGPYKFKEWVRGSHINFVRNPNYWEKGKPYLDAIIFRDISGAVVGVVRMRSGSEFATVAPHFFFGQTAFM